MNHLMVMELARLRQQELLDEAARDQLAKQLSANRGMDNPRYLGTAIERFARRFLPVRLGSRQSTNLHTTVRSTRWARFLS
jgi:hypothetical protein